ncbi:hypothetical protein BJV82DRAFT_670019 [Fennellomyces sp. T-0311]|nr:hypothetical protein BJV82DRAFT_670019 [Fennellomyces sp. T-0311]
MSASSSSWDAYLTPQEKNAYAQYFRAANRSQSGTVTGPEAVQFFATSGVPNQILSEIWETADRDNVGYLTSETFAIALKLIACAQHGKEVSEPILATSVPLPQFEGLQVTSPSIQAPTDDGPGMKITAAEREKYSSIFRVHQPVDGVLDAANAKNIFMKSKLPTETLGQIWNLADVRQAGNLNQAEFAIAMHYIAKLMDGTLITLPTQLPPSVYATANGDTTVVQPSPRPAASPRPPQQQRSQTIDSLGTMAFSAPAQETTAWDVTPQEKIQFDAFFDKIDGQRTGFVQGPEAVEFFKNSRLPEVELAHIWDLADSKQQGRLSRDQFAVAMHLIHARLRGEVLPNTLPTTLVPPSPHPVAASPAMMATSLQHPPAAAPVQSPAMTGNIFDDQDLLGDFGNNDQLTQDTNQVNQMQNQMGALSVSTGEIKAQKLDTQQTLERLAQQKQELQAQLAQVQMAHEAEVKELNELQQQLENEKPGWIQAQQEHDAAQQQLAATQNEIAQLQQTLESSRAESEQLRQNVRTIQEETARLANELNSLRSQVKQQNMMLDINRRQVTASEQDRDQAKRDLADFKEERGLPDDIEIPEEPKPAEPKEVSSPAASSVISNSNSFFDVFSPKIEESKVSPAQAPAPAAALPADDFDAIFGSFAQSPAPSEKPRSQQDSPLSVFDPVGWATPPEKPATTESNTPAKSSRPAPPPPPPQSRHHRQTSESSHTTPTTATKKPRAPPPPPPSAVKNTAPPADEFDDAFSGQMSSAQVVSPSANTGNFADFDDAFGVFDKKEDKQEEEATKDKATSANDLNWASSFGGFDFEESKSKGKEDDDWDSIFGGSSASKAPATNVTTNTDKDAFVGFEDAFSNFDAAASPAVPASSAAHKKEPTTISTGGSSNLDELIKMGFGQKEAKEALDRYDQDLVKASNFLLDQTSK